MNSTSNFQPNWVSPPGDTISDILKERNISHEDFAKSMGESFEFITELIHGVIPITQNIADKIGQVLRTSADFWMRRESQYRESLKRLTKAEEDKWLAELPLRDMIKFGWLKKTENQLQTCLEYFNVPDVWTWRRKYKEAIAITAFRTSATFVSKTAAVSAWLRQGEIKSQGIKCKPWNKSLFAEKLNDIRILTTEKDPKKFLPKLTEICSECGVALVIARTPSGCSASGATKFLSEDRALLMLSIRYLSDDHFWFTFFHEAGHLLLHGNRKLFIENEKADKNEKINEEEREANEFSAQVLIPQKYQRRLRSLSISDRSIITFAREVGISPGIVVGQLQHIRRVEYKYFNGLKRKYNWDEIL
jgi:plasmid maintenance system antidote protein VapI/Zn-dependent peptidase ImmA (M78 family)